MRMNAGVNLPYGLFEFAKKGMQGDTHYTMDDLSIRARGYAELAFGHAHQITQNLTIGAKLKVLLGGADLDATVEDMDVRLNQDQWLIRAHAKVNTALKGAQYTLDEEGLVDGIDVESPGLGGFGLGLDLGATYKFTDGPLEGLTLSAAVLGLGFINWSDNIEAFNEGEDFVFDGFQNIASGFCYMHDVGKAVLRKSQRSQRFVSADNICFDCFTFRDFLIGQHIITSFCLHYSMKFCKEKYIYGSFTKISGALYIWL